ncbi:Dcp1p-Dcp2p decapping enzyme complex alpha subunit [Coemansia sp. RSA 1933]|nr:Dcp1p-Dcp2p decapping enzyme complex alpha subunit [Coemansia sp. RSA 1933]
MSLPNDEALPSIPGQQLYGSDAYAIRLRATDLTGTAKARFPGAQPVSLSRTIALKQLMEEDFMVCEKSDGIRVLVLMVDGGKTFMLTRKHEVFYVPGVAFPVPVQATPQAFHDGTLIDAELVLDTEADGRRVRRLLAFDALVVAHANCMQRSLEKRLGYLNDHVMRPFIAMCAQMPEAARAALPFQAEMKRFERSYAVPHLYETLMPALKHKSDGLIFTSVSAPYTPGTCHTIYKWKPNSENSVDFKVKLELMDDGTKSIQLLAGKGAGCYTYFSNLLILPGEWDRHFAHIADLDGRIIEVVHDPAYEEPFSWRFLRFRDDKDNPNYYTVVSSVVESIKDNIELDELKASTVEMRTQWKRRHNESL